MPAEGPGFDHPWLHLFEVRLVGKRGKGPISVLKSINGTVISNSRSLMGHVRRLRPESFNEIGIGLLVLEVFEV